MSDRNAVAEVVRELFTSWYPAVVRYGCRLSGSLAIAEDLAQDAFLALYRDLRKGTKIDHPRAWLLMVVRRRAMHEVWSLKNSPVSLEPLEALDTSPAGHVPPEEPEPDLSRLLSALTPRELQVVLLRLESMKYREIAAELNISAKSVCTLLARALRKLQRIRAGKSGGDSAVRHVENDFPETLH